MGGDSAADLESDDRSWEHFVKVMKLRENQRKALEDRDIDGIIAFHHVAGKDDFFQFDDERTETLFPSAKRALLHDAWTWIGDHREEIDDDDDDSWFLGNFSKLFSKEVSKKKRAAEAQLRKEEDKRYKITEPHQANASSFTGNGTRTMQGVATLPPVFHDHLIPEQVVNLFTSKFEIPPSAAEKQVIDKLSTGFLSHGTTYTLKAVPENSKDAAVRTVQVHHLDFIAEHFDGQITTERVFKDGLEKGSKRTLEDIGLIGGIATPGSFPVAYFHTGPLEQLTPPVKFITTSMFEVKDTAASPDSGHGEGIANATNAAVAMARVGIPSSRVVVPVFTTTGSMVQVAAVYMLEPSLPDKPSLPAVCFVTPVLRLSIREEREKAATILVAMWRHKTEVEQYVKSNSLTRPRSVAMGLDPAKYHSKLMDDFFPVLTFKDASLTHMLEVTSRLAGTSYACLPLAIRLKDKKCNCDAIIFEKLVGYRIGLPNEHDDRVALVSTMQAAVDDMHQKGVVHTDLYVSNFMWMKLDSGSFSVKIIDFDTAHEVGQPLTAATWARLHELKSEFCKLGHNATIDHDNLYMTMLKEKIDEESLRIGGAGESEEDVKNRLDGACTSFMADTFAAVDWSTLDSHTE